MHCLPANYKVVSILLFSAIAQNPVTTFKQKGSQPLVYYNHITGDDST